MPKPNDRTDDIAGLYARYASELQGSVAARVHTDDPATIEDACAFAWTVLIDRPDVSLDRESVRGWLYVTACREAIRLHRRARDRFHAPEIVAQRPDLIDHAPAAAEIAAQRERLRLITELPERQRRILWRQVVGYSYDEIAQHEAITRTSTNKQIAKARRNLRKIAGEGGENQPPDA